MSTNTQPDFADIYGGAYLKADLDIEDEKPQTLAIAGVEAKDFGINKETGKNERKLVLSFVGNDKKLVLNKTNAGIVATLYGPKSAEWVGKRVTLYAADVTFGNEVVRAIRIKSKVPA